MNDSGSINITYAENYFSNEVEAKQPVMISMGVLGGLSVIGNVVLLILSKFASGGKSASLVFLRSLVISDAIVGAFGIFKALVLTNIKHLLVDCFLPEALFVTASTASLFTLLGLSLDCCFRLYQPLKYMLYMDKKNIISVMVFLWNFSFISGFVPPAGWHNIDFVCIFMYYFSVSYLIFLAFVWIVVTVGCIVTQIISRRLINKVNQNRTILTCNSKEFQKYNFLIDTICIDLFTWMLCFLPFLLYIISVYIMSSSSFSLKQLNFNVYILYFMPIFLFRSFLNSIIHGYRTVQIHYVMKHLSRKVSKIIGRKQFSLREDKVTRAIVAASTQTSRKSSNRRKEIPCQANNNQTEPSDKSSDFTTSTTTISVIITDESMAESTQF